MHLNYSDAIILVQLILSFALFAQQPQDHGGQDAPPSQDAPAPSYAPAAGYTPAPSFTLVPNYAPATRSAFVSPRTSSDQGPSTGQAAAYERSRTWAYLNCGYVQPEGGEAGSSSK